jgi:hypothetical protein
MKRIVSVIVSLLILAFLYWKIGPENRAQLIAIFRNCDPLWMTLSLEWWCRSPCSPHGGFSN